MRGWTADGRFLHVWQRGAQPKIILLNPETGERRVLREVSRQPDESIGTLVVSRNGGAYAYVALTGVSELYLVEGLR